MSKTVTKLILAFLVTAALQVLWHWLLSAPSNQTSSLAQWYFSYDPRVHKGVAGWFDLMLPCMWLGAFLGVTSRDWAPRKASGFVVGAGMGLVALLPVYAMLFHKEHVWWWPRTAEDAVVFFLEKLVEAIAVVGVFTHSGRCFAGYFREPRCDG